MIDFKQKRFMGVCSSEAEILEVLESYSAKIRKDLDDSKQNFFWLGVHLIDLYRVITMKLFVANMVLICLSARETAVQISFLHIALTSSGLTKRR